ncbi:hypothetical protein BS47DRAFT_1368110 [Hydnum rufescens UP504]|uniref:Uncharacterized protein n=1 Tax=Hydnum rufescens UP504 TaxID=1448309 RepID=A0A9P6AGN2_9AGAM|nr:hypothetical protein BS47DRAFT_1368110 [Hydnum rufescens UP504]
MVPHTHPGGCVALLGPISLCETLPKECTDGTLGEIQWQCHTPTKVVHSLHNIQPNQCTDQVQDETQDHTATHTPQPLIFHNIYKDETNMAPHTHFGTCVAISVPHTCFSRCVAILAPLSLCKTPSDEWPEKAYGKIQSVQPIRPQPPSLKNYNTTTNQICHTPAEVGTFPP